MPFFFTCFPFFCSHFYTYFAFHLLYFAFFAIGKFEFWSRMKTFPTRSKSTNLFDENTMIANTSSSDSLWQSQKSSLHVHFMNFLETVTSWIRQYALSKTEICMYFAFYTWLEYLPLLLAFIFLSDTNILLKISLYQSLVKHSTSLRWLWHSYLELPWNCISPPKRS